MKITVLMTADISYKKIKISKGTIYFFHSNAVIQDVSRISFWCLKQP